MLTVAGNFFQTLCRGKSYNLMSRVVEARIYLQQKENKKTL